MHLSPLDYVRQPQDYAAGLLLVLVAFAVREFVIRAGSSLWDDLRRLFDVTVPHELVSAASLADRPALPSEKRRSCRRCGSALVFGSAGCDTCARLGIPPEPIAPAWAPPVEETPIEFASHATWATARSVPHRVLGPAVLRLKVAMGAVLAVAAWNLVLSGFAPSGWYRMFLVAAAVINLVLLFGLRQKSLLALGGVFVLIAIAGVAELRDPQVGWALAVLRALALLAVAQAYGPVSQLRAADRRAQPVTTRAA